MQPRYFRHSTRFGGRTVIVQVGGTNPHNHAVCYYEPWRIDTALGYCDVEKYGHGHWIEITIGEAYALAIERLGASEALRMGLDPLALALEEKFEPAMAGGA